MASYLGLMEDASEARVKCASISAAFRKLKRRLNAAPLIVVGEDGETCWRREWGMPLSPRQSRRASA